MVAAALGACVLAACGGRAERAELIGTGGTVAGQPAAGSGSRAGSGSGGTSSSGGRLNIPGSGGSVTVAGSGGAGAEGGEGGDTGSTGGEGGASGECAPLEYMMDLGGFDVYGPCPVNGNLPECDGGDQGASVARTADCWEASSNSGCDIWAEPASTMLVVIPYFACAGWVEIHSVLACAESISIEYALVTPCADCDGPRNMGHFLRLTNDPRPVIATAVDEPGCRP